MPKITALPASPALLLTDLLPVVNDPGGVPVTSKATLTQLQTLLNSLYLPLAGGTLTGKLIITQATANTSILTSTGYSLTGANAQNLLDFAGTWNTSGNPTALRIAITNTASGATSKFLEFLAGAGGATSTFAVDKSGVITLGPANPWTIIPEAASGNNLTFRSVNWDATAGFKMSIAGTAFTVSNIFKIGFNSLGDILSGTIDTYLTRDSAGVMALKNTTTAQVFRWYRTFTDASNYERGALQTAAGQVIVAAETGGSGTADIDLSFTPAGAGLVRFGTRSAIAAETITGYITIKDSGGTTRKLSVVS